MSLKVQLSSDHDLAWWQRVRDSLFIDDAIEAHNSIVDEMNHHLFQKNLIGQGRANCVRALFKGKNVSLNLSYVFARCRRVLIFTRPKVPSNLSNS